MTHNTRAKGLASLYDVMPDESGTAPIAESLKKLSSDNSRHYIDEEAIARGGMKAISKVYDPKTGRHVALARLLPNSPEELYEPFLREARLTAMLDHPNIITVHDIGIDNDDAPYFTMELKTGKSLRDSVTCCSLFVDSKTSPAVNSSKNQQTIPGGSSSSPDNEQLTTNNSRSDLLEIFIKICDAIAYAHSQNILHLDLKPDNIQVGRYGEVIVCDWGLGKKIGDKEYDGGELDQLLLNEDLLYNMTQSGEIKGTPGFMAPEQIRPDEEKTFQTDIYVLGCLLYTMLCNEPPFRGSLESVFDQTLAGDYRQLQRNFVKKAVPQSLQAVVLKAMALSPSDRYNSVNDLRSDVHNYLSGFTVSAENSTIFKEVKQFYKRNRSQCRIAASFILLICALSVTFVYNLNQSRIEAETERTISEKQRQLAEEQQKLAEEHRQLAEKQRQLAEDQRQLAEANLEMYVQEKEKIRGLKKLRSKEIVLNSRPSRFWAFFSNPEASLKEQEKKLKQALQLDPTNKRAHSLMGTMYFTKQDFKKANEAYKRSDIEHPDLHTLSKEFVEKPRLRNGLLRIDDFAELIERLVPHGHRHFLSEQMVEYYTLKINASPDDYFHRMNPDKLSTEYAPLVEQLLRVWGKRKRWNPININATPPPTFTFNYDTESKSLKLNGAGFASAFSDSTVGSGKTVLRFIPIKHLDISSTQFAHLNELTGLIHLTTLDIRNTKVTNLSPLAKFPLLHTLTIAPGQFTAKQLATVPDHIKVVKRQ